MRTTIPPREPGSRRVNVIIDTPAGSRNKYKYDRRLAVFRVSRVLPEGISSSGWRIVWARNTTWRYSASLPGNPPKAWNPLQAWHCEDSSADEEKKLQRIALAQGA